MWKNREVLSVEKLIEVKKNINKTLSMFFDEWKKTRSIIQGMRMAVLKHLKQLLVDIVQHFWVGQGDNESNKMLCSDRDYPTDLLSKLVILVGSNRAKRIIDVIWSLEWELNGKICWLWRDQNEKFTKLIVICSSGHNNMHGKRCRCQFFSLVPNVKIKIFHSMLNQYPLGF